MRSLALLGLATLASGGQRFRLAPDEDTIVEAKADEAPMRSAAMAAAGGGLGGLGGHGSGAAAAAQRRGETVPAEHGDLDFYKAWFYEDDAGDLVQLGNQSAFGEFPSPTALAVLMKKSIFSLSTTGKVYERFHNQVKWVYVKHEDPSDAPLVALTAVRNRGTYFASDSAGRVFQRLRVENGLGWMDVTSSENHRIYLGGVPSTEGNVFFIAEDGKLLERQFDQTRSNVGGMWSDHGMPGTEANAPVKLVAVVDAHTLSYGSVFSIGADGHLYNLETITGDAAPADWADHGLADGSKLAPLPGVALKDLNGASGTPSSDYLPPLPPALPCRNDVALGVTRQLCCSVSCRFLASSAHRLWLFGCLQRSALSSSARKTASWSSAGGMQTHGRKPGTGSTTATPRM